MPLQSVPRLYRLPESSFFLFGLRGVGKSTWIRSQLPDARRFDLLDETLYQQLLADPAPFAAELRTLPPGSWVVLDETQRLPGLLNEVHRFIEERRLRFALLGSSARKLHAAGVNLLAGRALWREMFPLTPEELGAELDLERTLAIGTLPLVLASPEPQETLRAYVQLYLREEIKGEALVRNLPGFARFLPVAALCHSQTINISGLGRDAGVARTTVEGYIQILEDTLLARRLPAYTARLRVRERKHPKLYWVDPGVARAAKAAYGPLVPEERGALLEGYIHTLLLTYIAERDLATEISLLVARRLASDRGRLPAEPRHRALRPGDQGLRRASSPSTSPGCAQSPTYPDSHGECSYTKASAPAEPRTESSSGRSPPCSRHYKQTAYGHDT